MNPLAAARTRSALVVCLLLAAALTPALYAAQPAKGHAVSLNDLAATRPAEWLPVPIVRAAGDAFLRVAKVAREGTDITIVAYSYMYTVAM